MREFSEVTEQTPICLSLRFKDLLQAESLGKQWPIGKGAIRRRVDYQSYTLGLH